MQKRRPLVSVVTPSYNQARFLEETILSVLNQGYPNIEYIIIDGGSTDGSIDIIEKYKHRLAYWVTEQDRGQSHAINKGWQHATGEIIAYLNSDDCYTAGAISRAVEAFLADDDVYMIYSDAVVVDEQGVVLRNLRSRAFDFGVLVMGDNYIPQPTVFVRRTALDAVDWLDERLHLTMDYDLWLRLALQFKACYLPNPPLARFREHHAAKSTVAANKVPMELRQIVYRLFQRDDLPAEVRQLRRQALSLRYFDEAANALQFNQTNNIIPPLVRACFESRAEVVVRRPKDVLYLLVRAILPQQHG